MGRKYPVALFAVVAGFLVLGLAYAIVSPPFENPDEMSHAEYAAFLGSEFRFPVLQRDCVRLAFHPPLYPALLAPLAYVMGLNAESVMAGHRVNPEFGKSRMVLVHGYPDEAFPFSGASRFVFIGRLLSLFFGAVALLYVYRLALAIFDRDPVGPVLACAAVASIPQFQYVSASLNHDALAAACATAMVYHAVLLTRRPDHVSAAICGLALGLGMLTKSSLVAMAPVPALALAVALGRAKSRFRAALTLYGTALVVAGWWYVRNQALYGSPFPVVHLHQTTWVGAGLVNRGDVDAKYLWGVARQMFESFWFLAGLMNVAGREWMYWVWGGVSLVAIAGMGALSADRRGAVLVAAWVLIVLAVFQYNFAVFSSQGRYLFVVVATLGVAISRAVTLLPPTATRPTAVGLVILLAVTSIACFLLCFVPAYAVDQEPQRPTAIETARLFCGNEYSQRFAGAGGVVNGFRVRGRRVGGGEFDLDLVVRDVAGGAVVSRGRVRGAALASELEDKVIDVDPFPAEAGESYVVTFSAPTATPIDKPTIEYSVGDAEGFLVGGVSIPGHLKVAINTP